MMDGSLLPISSEARGARLNSIAETINSHASVLQVEKYGSCSHRVAAAFVQIVTVAWVRK